VIRARQNFEITTIKMQKDFDAGLLHSERVSLFLSQPQMMASSQNPLNHWS
jgi:hypothetical protein